MNALNSVGEPVRQLLQRDLAGPRSIEDWELACTDHLHAINTRPAVHVRDDVQIDLAEVQRQLRDTSDISEICGLRRVVAVLSTLHANVLSRLGEHGAALRWWHIARTAADASQDLHLRLGVRATEAGHVLGHGQRDPSTVLRITEQALRMAGDTRSLGKAFTLCSQAKALSMLGRHEEARKALATCRDLMASEPPAASILPEVWQMRGGQLEYSGLWVSASAGDEDATADARKRMLAIVGDYQYRVATQLHTALCMVVCGDVDEGLDLAASIINELQPSYRTHLINETGRRVLRAVPRDQRTRPAVSEFRELLTNEQPST